MYAVLYAVHKAERRRPLRAEATGAEARARRKVAVLIPGPGLARLLAGFALAGGFVFVVSSIVAGALEPGYSHLEEGISALSTSDARHPWIVAGGLILFGLSVAALGPAMRAVLPRRRAANLVAWCLLIAGVGFAVAGALPMDCSLSVDERCRTLSDAGELSWHHYPHLWVGLVIQVALSVAPFAVIRALWPRPAAIALLSGSIPAVAFGIVAIPLYGLEGAPDGLIQRVQYAPLFLFLLLLAGGVLHSTRPEPRMPKPTPLRPREFFGRAWTGEGQLLLYPTFLWRRFAPRFRARRETTWLSDEAFVVEDRAEFLSGHVESRRRFCELVAPDRFRITSADLLEPTELRVDESGFRVAPYRMRVPYGPVGVTLRCWDELRLEPDGTLVDTIDMRFLGVPVARVVVRARLTDPGDG